MSGSSSITLFLRSSSLKNRPNSNRWTLIFDKTEYLENSHIPNPNHPMMPRFL
ncbi:hypothetical protein PGT21_024493 [Puccinia graminis f. sp. tritici]|uniref:Uncharacterized protein n=1 Tax=Puccinia graminis f. sp. tritici TaxID=56615 RepID=A0A5B0NWT9_PUCGR|nr:hypothetical protein PGT21_024493 [Puccinia graminis f. sp. tritici]KAA1092289.1 hypothetical protein PGTUg99_014723 [Puccinia graminis f. sp. tritici]